MWIAYNAGQDGLGRSISDPGEIPGQGGGPVIRGQGGMKTGARAPQSFFSGVVGFAPSRISATALLRFRSHGFPEAAEALGRQRAQVRRAEGLARPQ